LLISQSALAVFTDVTTTSQINHQHFTIAPSFEDYQTYMSGGVTAGDFDNDGWTDLYFTRLDDSNILYRNQGDGTFADVTQSSFGANHLSDSQSNGAAWGDIDNDGDLDMYVTSLASNSYHLFINDGNGAFTEEAAMRGASISGTDLHYGQSVTFGDYDVDGYLDMYVSEWRRSEQNPTNAAHNSRLLRNLGAENPGHFTDVTQIAGVRMDEIDSSHVGFDSRAFTGRFSDFDQDGLPDLAVASDFGTSRLFWNNGDGTFTDGTDVANVGTDQFGMGSTIADFDGDGDLDWYVTSIYREGLESHNGNRLYRNDGNRTFTDITDEAGVRDGGWGWGTSFFDHDNDGDLDLIGANGQDFAPASLTLQSQGFETNPVKFWENDGTGGFTENAAALGLTDEGAGKGLVTLDYDNDGDLDVVIANNEGAPVIYRNDGNANGWLKIKTIGTESNADGLGAKITVTPDGSDPDDFLFWEVNAGSNFLGHSDSIAHFGLGDFSGTIDQVTIEWPTTGIIQVLEDVSANELLTVVEPTIGLAGDFNGDGIVDAADFTVWQDNLGAGDESSLFGNGDGLNGVDAGDLALWQANFGMASEASGGGSANVVVPEPDGMVWWMMAGLILLRSRCYGEAIPRRAGMR